MHKGANLTRRQLCCILGKGANPKVHGYQGGREEYMGHREFQGQQDLFCMFIFVKIHGT